MLFGWIFTIDLLQDEKSQLPDARTVIPSWKMQLINSARRAFGIFIRRYYSWEFHDGENS